MFLEQLLLTETLWTALLVGAVYAAVRWVSTRSWKWLVVSSLLLGLSVIVRNVSMFLPLALALWAVFAYGGPRRDWLRNAARALVPAGAVVVTYVVVASSLGTYTGMGEMTGSALYARTAQFADCSRFTPPEGTAGLCEKQPIGERPGPLFYYFDPATPARRVFPAMSPADGEIAGAFGKQAMLHSRSTTRGPSSRIRRGTLIRTPGFIAHSRAPARTRCRPGTSRPIPPTRSPTRTAS